MKKPDNYETMKNSVKQWKLNPPKNIDKHAQTIKKNLEPSKKDTTTNKSV